MTHRMSQTRVLMLRARRRDRLSESDPYQHEPDEEDTDVVETWEDCDHSDRAAVQFVPLDVSVPEELWTFELIILCSECGWSTTAPITWRAQADMIIKGPGYA